MSLITPVLNADNVSNYTGDNGLMITDVLDIRNNAYRLITSTQTTGTLYTITVNNNITDSAGNIIDSGSNTVSFTGYDPIPPTIDSFSLQDSDSRSATHTNDLEVIIKITESDTNGTVEKWLLKENNATPTVRDFYDNGETSRPLNYSLTNTEGSHTLYMWVLDNDDAISLAAMATIELDAKSPGITSVEPSDDAKNIVIDTNITIQFSETINADTLNLSVTDAGGNVIEGTDSINGSTVIFDPSSNFNYETDYSIQVNSVQDLAGNSLGATYRSTFRTMDFPTSPAGGVSQDSDDSGGGLCFITAVTT